MAIKITNTNVPTTTRSGVGRKAIPLTSDENAVVDALKNAGDGAITFTCPTYTGNDDKTDNKAVDAFVRHVRGAFSDEDVTIRSMVENGTITLWKRAGRITRPRRADSK